ncbi:MAG: radical SAM/SPASM domain-containing protein [Bacillota bacterium]
MKGMNIPVNPTYHEINNEIAKQWEENRSKKYKEYRKKWVENPRNFIVEDAPLHLDIEPTNACNLKCPMCPRTVLIQEDKSKFKVSSLDMETYKKIIDEAVAIGVYSIKLNWLGEPLVHPNIVDMVKYAKIKGIEDVMFNTNGVALDENMSIKLIDAGLDKIFFSFDSPFKEKYEAIRVGATFEKTLNNIKRFVEIRKEKGKDTPLTRISMVLMETNQDEYEKFVDLFQDIVDVVAYVEYREPVSKKTREEYNEQFACSELWQRMFIAADGDVIVCCVDSQKEYIVGNIYNDTIKNIWKNEKYNKIRQFHKNGEYYKIDMCAKCDLPCKKESGTV